MKNIILLGSILFLLNSCGSVPITGRRQLNLVSDTEVLSLSAQSYSEYMKKAKLSTNKKNTEMVSRCGKKIQTAVESYLKSAGMENQLANYKWEFSLVDDKTVNAFCMPGGKVVVYEGILPVTLNEAGLAVVIGHEIAHAVAKHSNERMSQQMIANLGGETLNALMQNKSAESRKLAETVYGLGANYGIMLPYSRKQEYEADKLGLIFMAMAGYNPEAAIDFWTKMSQKGSKALEFMSTHPSDEHRIEYIKQCIPTAKTFKK